MSRRACRLPTSRSGRLLLALLAAGAALPALGQDRPESILPPGFGQPAPAPTPTPAPPGAGVAPASPPGAVVQPLPAPTPTPSPTPSATPTPIDPEALAEYALPGFARRSLAEVGAAGVAEGGVEPNAFAGADGPFLEGLMRRLDTPIPSRWAHILLRRALASRVETPNGVNGADFAAERAWLLLRMGEAQAARAVVQGVDVDNYTPKLFEVALNAMLAASDPAGLCPLADRGAGATGERGWVLAQAMCASLAGSPARAQALVKAARRRRVASGIDLLLAQKVAGAAGGRQAVTIEWDGVDRLTAWRWGLASATGVAVPPELMAAAGPQVTCWQALSPAVPANDRLPAAEAAAGRGVLSSAALVDLYATLGDDGDAAAATSAAAEDLRIAYADRSADARARALGELWGETPSYPRLVLTARAAARLPVAEGADADRLVASMLTAGLDRAAARWARAVPRGGDAWAMIQLSDPDAGGPLSYRDLSAYSGKGDAALKQRLFFAGLAGLGRLAPDDVERAAQALGVRIGAGDSWTRALDAAAARGQQGTVALLAAVGMQTAAWRGVPPEALYRIVAALRAVGLGGEARMIAAEAVARA